MRIMVALPRGHRGHVYRLLRRGDTRAERVMYEEHVRSDGSHGPVIQGSERDPRPNGADARLHAPTNVSPTHPAARTDCGRPPGKYVMNVPNDFVQRTARYHRSTRSDPRWTRSRSSRTPSSSSAWRSQSSSCGG